MTVEQYFPESKSFAALIEGGNALNNAILDADLVDFNHAEISKNADGVTTVELPVSKGAIADEIVAHG